ncbi:pilus assembly protein TadE [Vibrio azureus]|uniref:TadE-like domain-containing protein n=1 Tax=Vibrio azureus NBRC 104587 TaxID=1219077 RepID=U3C7I2_9VIBR|nr:TadE/TadG family type IV pilus assembly protein [Vibrio azureus]AUI86826.1 pilus assembly protein TadE [Vibrio azureus]GAD74398.1 hypothetical protein VAZ01S_010_00510 [Vibrio azureus NBRC 104587]
MPTLLRSSFKSRGIAALEFIIVLPVLLMLVVLVIDVCRVFIEYTTLNKALHGGVRYAVMDTYGTLTLDTIADETKIKNFVMYGHPTASITPIIDTITAEDISITPPTDSNKAVVVSATYQYSPIFAQLPFTEQNLQFDIVATATMRVSP